MDSSENVQRILSLPEYAGIPLADKGSPNYGLLDARAEFHPYFAICVSLAVMAETQSDHAATDRMLATANQ